LNHESEAEVTDSSTAAPGRPSAARRWLLLAAKLMVVAALVAFLASKVSWDELSQNMRRITPFAIIAGASTQVFSFVIATSRWRMLMRAYGASHFPPYRTMLRVYMVAYFYNTFLPGAVGGDVLRGVVMRRSFGERGATTASLAIVLVERALGMLGALAVLTLAALAASSDAPARKLLYIAPLVLCAVLAAILALANGHRLAPYVPIARVAALLRDLPTLSSPGYFTISALMSVVVQLIYVACGHVLLLSAYPAIRWSDSLFVMPLTAVATFIPLSVAGAGPRDVALVSMYTLSGVPRGAALAGSAALLVVSWLVASLGGLLHLRGPLALPEPPAPEPEAPEPEAPEPPAREPS
jgi:uncharacterized membrane protein YbhN (UPF0104 family)